MHCSIYGIYDVNIQQVHCTCIYNSQKTDKKKYSSFAFMNFQNVIFDFDIHKHLRTDVEYSYVHNRILDKKNLLLLHYCEKKHIFAG